MDRPPVGQGYYAEGTASNAAQASAVPLVHAASLLRSTTSRRRSADQRLDEEIKRDSWAQSSVGRVVERAGGRRDERLVDRSGAIRSVSTAALSRPANLPRRRKVDPHPALDRGTGQEVHSCVAGREATEDLEANRPCGLRRTSRPELTRLRPPSISSPRSGSGRGDPRWWSQGRRSIRASRRSLPGQPGSRRHPVPCRPPLDGAPGGHVPRTPQPEGG